MALTKAGRTVLQNNVPTWNRFREGGYSVKDNDFFIDNNNVPYSYLGDKPHYVVAGTTPETEGGVWSADNPQGLWKPVVNGSNVLGALNNPASLGLLTPIIGDMIVLNGTQGGSFVAVPKGDYVEDGGYILPSASPEIVWKRNTDVAHTSNFGITADTEDAGYILGKAFHNIKHFILDTDINIRTLTQLQTGVTLDLNGNTINGFSNCFDANNSKYVVIKNGKYKSDGNSRLITGVTKGIKISGIECIKGALAITFVGTYDNRNENILVEDCTHDGRTQSSVLGGFFSVDFGNNIKVTRCVGFGAAEFIDLNNFCTNVEISYNKVLGTYRENVFDINSSQHVHVHHNIVELDNMPEGARPVWVSSYSGSSWPVQADPYYRHSDDIIFEDNIFKINGEFPSDYVIIMNSGTGDVPVPEGRLLRYTFSRNKVLCSNIGTRAKMQIGVVSKYDLTFSDNNFDNITVNLNGLYIRGGNNLHTQTIDAVGNALIARGFIGELLGDIYDKYSPSPENKISCGVVVLNDCPDMTLYGFRFKGKLGGYGAVSGSNNTKPKVLDFTTDMELTSGTGVRLSGDAILRRL